MGEVILIIYWIRHWGPEAKISQSAFLTSYDVTPYLIHKPQLDTLNGLHN